MGMSKDSDVTATMKSKRLGWAGHVWRVRERTIGQQLEAEERKIARQSKTKVDRQSP